MSKIAVIGIMLLAAGCGFQLRGELTMPPEMSRTYIATDDSHSLFYRKLRRQLMESGVELVDAEAEATARFAITYDETDQRVLSVSARNVPTEYEVYYTIQYAVDTGSTSLIAPQTLTLTRDYTYDSTLVLGKAREEQLLREAIVEDLVRIVLKQIDTL